MDRPAHLSKPIETLMLECTEKRRKLFVVLVIGLPKDFRNPHTFRSLAESIPNITIEEVQIYTKCVKVLSPDPFIVDRIQPIRQIANTKELLIKSPNVCIYDYKEQYCVIFRIPEDQGKAKDLERYMNQNNFSFIRAWRVTSRVTKGKTTLVKVLTAVASTARELMLRGVVINGARYYAWPARKPENQNIVLV